MILKKTLEISIIFFFFILANDVGNFHGHFALREKCIKRLVNCLKNLQFLPYIISICGNKIQ